MEATIARQAEEPAAATTTLQITENPATGQQRPGNANLVKGVRFSKGVPHPRKLRKRDHIQHCYEVESICFQMLASVRDSLGLKPTICTPGQSNDEQNGHLSGNGGNGCESLSTPSAPSPAVEVTRDHAQIVGLLVRGMDTALERLRVLRNVPDPGCRRPGEPVPKARKPTNRAPDSLACGSDTPTGSVPR